MTSAIICEFNPFHFGHSKIINEAKQNGPVVILMSGNFVQRGEAAFYDKYIRAEAAIASGADLVLELPFPYCCSYAQSFARSSISILTNLSFVDALVFGTEGNLSEEELVKEANRLTSADFVELTKKMREENPDISDIKLREAAYEKLYGEKFSPSPNDILALEYVCTIIRANSNLKICPVKREGGWSAHKAREIIAKKGGVALESIMPKECASVFNSGEAINSETLEKIILASLRLCSPEEKSKYEGCSGGFSQKAFNAASESATYPELIEKLTDKGITRAGAKRRLINMLFEIRREDITVPPLWTMVLGANDTGRALLKKAGEGIKIITKPAHAKQLRDETFSRQFNLECRAESIYSLLKKESGNSFFMRKPHIEKNED